VLKIDYFCKLGNKMKARVVALRLSEKEEAKFALGRV
jgi:hypothetical protein